MALKPCNTGQKDVKWIYTYTYTHTEGMHILYNFTFLISIFMKQGSGSELGCLDLNPSLPIIGLPRWLSGKEFACQCTRYKRQEFNPCIVKIPWSRKWQPTPVFLPGKFQRTEEPGGPQSKELDTTKQLNRRRQWHPAPVLLPGKSHGWRSLVGCSPWGR